MQRLIIEKTTLISIAVFAWLGAATISLAESSREQLNILVAQLQANPSDTALREQIIKLAQGIKPPAAVPEEARRLFVQGNSAFGDMKSSKDVDRALALYRDASNHAPWWADAYFNLAKAYEQKQSYADAIAALKLYLLAAPKAPDAREAQDKIYAMEEKADRLAKAATDQAAATQQAVEAAAQRKLWATSLTQQLNSMFAGKLVRSSTSCTVGTIPLGGGATRDNGCSLQEYSGKNWTRYDNVYPAGVRFELSLDGEKVLFHEGFDNGSYGAGEFPARVGTPMSLDLNDISWVDSDGKPLQIRFWTNDNGVIFETSSSPVPPESPTFNANTRYHYQQNVAR